VLVYQIDGRLDAMVATTVREALNRLPSSAILAIDIPIGLPQSGDRSCCKQGRKILQARRSSVFPVPVRACINAGTSDEAKSLHYLADGRKISAQAWAILPKIREVDILLCSDHSLRSRIFEIHPEVTFCRWHGQPMQYRKKAARGYEEREALIDAEWPGERTRLRGKIGGQAGRDDLNDAFAALWTARRIADRTAAFLSSPDRDEVGLPIRIVS
jgi:predicted RNase H-like nuclease